MRLEITATFRPHKTDGADCPSPVVAKYHYYAPAASESAIDAATVDLHRRLGLRGPNAQHERLNIDAVFYNHYPATGAEISRHHRRCPAATGPAIDHGMLELQHQLWLLTTKDPGEPTVGSPPPRAGDAVHHTAFDLTDAYRACELGHTSSPSDPSAPDPITVAEHRMLYCGPGDVWLAKAEYRAARARADDHRRFPPPPSPPPCPPGSPRQEPARLSIDLGSLETASSSGGDAPPPSPPPSPPHSLEERLSMLTKAEDAVARSYSFPAEPALFETDVLPHLNRLIISIGRRPMIANARAVLAVLIRSDDKNDSPSDLFVYSLMEVPMATFVRWKAIIDTLRAAGGYGASAALLSLSEGAGDTPPPSAPPSPPHAEGFPCEPGPFDCFSHDDAFDSVLDDLDTLEALDDWARAADTLESVADAHMPLRAPEPPVDAPNRGLAVRMGALDITEAHMSSGAPPRPTASAPTTPRDARRARAGMAARAPPEPALGARRTQIVRLRTRQVGRAMWIAARSLRFHPYDERPLNTKSFRAGLATDCLAEFGPEALISAAAPALYQEPAAPPPPSAPPSPPPPEDDDAAAQHPGRATAIPRPHLHAGTDSVWNGLAVSCSATPDDTGGMGLCYVGAAGLSRGTLIGIFLADTFVTKDKLDGWMTNEPLCGEYAVTSRGWALIDSMGRSLISKVNEGARPNVEIVELDINTTDDSPSHTLMAMFTVADEVVPGETLYTDYGTAYDAVRKARGYARPYDPEAVLPLIRGRNYVNWLKDSDVNSEELEQIVRGALTPGQMRDAKKWGGVLDHPHDAGSPSDPNRSRGRRPTVIQTAPRGGRTIVSRAATRRTRADAPINEFTDEHAHGLDTEAHRAFNSHRNALGDVHSQLLGRSGARAAAPTVGCSSAQHLNRPDHPSQHTGAHVHARLRWAGAGDAPRGMGSIDLHEGYNGFSISSSSPMAPGRPCALNVGYPTWGKLPHRVHDGRLCPINLHAPPSHRGGEFWIHITNAKEIEGGSMRQGHASILPCAPMHAHCSDRRRSPLGAMTARLENATTSAASDADRGPAEDATPLQYTLRDGDTITLGTPAADVGTSARHPPARPNERHEWALRLEMPPAAHYSGLRPPPRSSLSRRNARCFLDLSRAPSSGDATSAAPPSPDLGPTTPPPPSAPPSPPPPEEDEEAFQAACGAWADGVWKDGAFDTPPTSAAEPTPTGRAAASAADTPRGDGPTLSAVTPTTSTDLSATPPTRTQRLDGARLLSQFIDDGLHGADRALTVVARRAPQRLREPGTTSGPASAPADLAPQPAEGGDAAAAPPPSPSRGADTSPPTSAPPSPPCSDDDNSEAPEPWQGSRSRLEADTTGAPHRTLATQPAVAPRRKRGRRSDAAAAPKGHAPPKAVLRDDHLFHDCSCCGAAHAIPAPPRTLGGCLCGGGVCLFCHADTCACPWDGDTPAPPVPTSASMQRNAGPWGYIELPLGDPYAPTILLMGDAGGAMARACATRFPTEISITADYHTRRAAHHGLYWCGDVRDILWRQRWRIVIAHPYCHGAALSNTTGKEARIASGELWWGMAFTLLLYCAPADVVLIEQPASTLAAAYREPDRTMQYLDYGVGFSKQWCIWQRGGDGSFNAAAPTTPGAVTGVRATHRMRHPDRDEQRRIRSATPPDMATALCATVNLTRGPVGPQPRFHEEVEVLARGYRRVTGSDPPEAYAEATAEPLDPPARRAPRAHDGSDAPPARARHPLADLRLLGAGPTGGGANTPPPIVRDTL